MYEKFGTDKNNIQPNWFVNCVNIDTIIIQILIKYTSNSANLDSSESTNLDEHENRNANTGQASARV